MSALRLLAAMLLQRAASPHLFPGDSVHTEKTELMFPFLPFFLSFRNYPELVNWFTTVLEGGGRGLNLAFKVNFQEKVRATVNKL